MLGAGSIEYNLSKQPIAIAYTLVWKRLLHVDFVVLCPLFGSLELCLTPMERPV